MIDLSQRSTRPEVMDDDDVPTDIYARCQRELALINRLTLTHRPILRWLDRATRELPRGAAVSILDVACGHGDLLRTIGTWAARRGLNAALSGIDLNPRSGVVAAAATPPDMKIDYRTGNVFAYEPDPPPDFVVTSQFTHHLTDAVLVRFMGWLDTHAHRGWFIADLHRHALAYYGFPVLAWLARFHKIIRSDGMISVARGFRRTEWQRALEDAGLAEVRDVAVTWHIPFRYGIGRLKAGRPA